MNDSTRWKSRTTHLDRVLIARHHGNPNAATATRKSREFLSVVNFRKPYRTTYIIIIIVKWTVSEKNYSTKYCTSRWAFDHYCLIFCDIILVYCLIEKNNNINNMFYAVFIIKTQTREVFFSFPEMYTLIVILTRSFGPHDNSFIPVYPSKLVFLQ